MCKEEIVKRFQKFLKFYPDVKKGELAENIGIDIKTLRLIIENKYESNGERGLLDKIENWLNKKEKEKYNEILEDLREYIKIAQKPQSDVAAGIGISTAALSQILNNSYNGSINNIREKVETYLKREEEKKRLGVGNWEFVENSITRKIWGALKNAHIVCEMAAIVGPSGCGKTTTAKEYSMTDSTVVYLRVNSVTHATGMLRNIGKSIGVNCHARNNEILYDRIISKLSGTQRLLIIDEAQKLENRVIELIRDIHDECGIGVALIGHENTYNRMFGNKEEIFEQIIGRTLPVRIARVIKKNDIIKMIDVYYADATEEIKDELVKIGNSRGKLRMLVKVIQRAGIYAKLNGREKASIEDIKKSISYVSELIGETGEN